MKTLSVAMLVCTISYYLYGWSCLKTQYMIAEFKRYQLAHFRKLTGQLQLLGATGLAVGFLIPDIGGLAAAGLSLQMACGLGVRVKIKDSWFRCLPAIIYMIVCGWIATQLL